MSSKVYFPNLNGLRFFAALSVMVYHFFGIDAINGHFGVVLFFVLSGFLITYLLFEEKNNKGKIAIRKFYIRRILRIWPLYFFIVLIGTVAHFYAGESYGAYAEAIPYLVFFAPNVSFVMGATLKYAGVLWSVGSEEQFYLAWPWLIEKVNQRKVIYALILFVLAWTFLPHVIDYVNYNYLGQNQGLVIVSGVMGRMGFGAMATGAIIAYVAKFYPNKLKSIFHPVIQAITLGVVLVIWIGHYLPHTALTDEIYAILFAIMIANFALNPKVLFSLEYPVLNFLGKISFGLYVYHLIAFDVVIGLDKMFGTNLPLLVLFNIGVLLTVIISTLSYNYLEKPFLKLKSEKYTYSSVRLM